MRRRSWILPVLAAAAVPLALALHTLWSVTSPDILRFAAERGHAPTQFTLGEIYADGRGVPKNEEEAVKWWRAAAEQGHVNAQKKLKERGLEP